MRTGTLHASASGAWSLQTASQQVVQLVGNISSNEWYSGSLVRADGDLDADETALVVRGAEEGLALTLLALPQQAPGAQQGAPTGRISARAAVLSGSDGAFNTMTTQIAMLVVLLDFCGAGMRPAATREVRGTTFVASDPRAVGHPGAFLYRVGPVDGRHI